MKLKNALVLTLLFCSTAVFGFSLSSIFEPTSTSATPGSWISQEERTISWQTSNLDYNVLSLSLEAYLKARREGLDSKEMLTIIDYSKPSTEKRLWVINLRTGK